MTLRPGDTFRVNPRLDWMHETSAFGLNSIQLELVGHILTVKDVVDILGHRGYEDEEYGYLWAEEWVDKVEDITVVKTDIAPVS